MPFCRALASLLPLLLVACTPPPPPRPFTIVVHALSDEDEPLAGATVTLDGQPAGATDGTGQLIVQRRAPEGSRVAIEVAALPGYKPLDDAQAPLVLRRLVRPIDGTLRELPSEYTVRFGALQRQYAVLVDVGQPGLPVEAFGARQAVTNSRGVASFTYAGSPGDELAVRVSSAARPDLTPKVVSASFVLAARSEAYLVQGRFASLPPVVHHHHVAVLRPKRL